MQNLRNFGNGVRSFITLRNPSTFFHNESLFLRILPAFRFYRTDFNFRRIGNYKFRIFTVAKHQSIASVTVYRLGVKIFSALCFKLYPSVFRIRELYCVHKIVIFYRAVKNYLNRSRGNIAVGDFPNGNRLYNGFFFLCFVKIFFVILSVSNRF